MMTIKEIIDGLKFTMEMFLYNPTDGSMKPVSTLNDMDRTTYDACEGAIKLLEQQRWHSISEEPPKKDEDYIITYQWVGSYSGDIYKEVVVSRYYGDGEWDVGNHEVLAWKPLPTAYKECEE